MRESEIETKVTCYAKNRGWLTFKFTSPANRSVPDRIFIRSGTLLFIEFKAPGKKPTKLQFNMIMKLRSQGMKVVVIDDIEKGKRLIDRLTD